jgi:hypothetical protein
LAEEILRGKVSKDEDIVIDYLDDKLTFSKSL